MLVHKGGQINNVQLITRVRIAEPGCHNYKIAVSCVQRMEVIVKTKKERKSQGEGVGQGSQVGGGGKGVRVDVNGEVKLL